MPTANGPAGERQLTHEVRLHGIRRHDRAKGATYELRWMVRKKPKSKSFASRALAESFRSDLRAALNRGEAFDVSTGLPISLLPKDEEEPVTWWQWSLQYVDIKWPHLAPRSRRSVAEALTTATMALTSRGPNAPSDQRMREALMQWAYNTTRRKAGPPPKEFRAAVDWLSRHSRLLGDLESPKVLRPLIDALGFKLDGTPAGATTTARKRAVVHNALELAVEHDHFMINPMSKVKRVAPKVPERVDPRVVVNHTQARALLDAVAADASTRWLTAFYACIYYAALRPSEALDLAESDLLLPEDDAEWGEIHVGSSNPEVARAWTDSGARIGRHLKHRAQGEIRIVPAPPQLVVLLRQHILERQIPVGGRLFRGPRGGHLSEDTYSKAWQLARERAFTAREAASVLAGRPYDLRHAAVSTWLAAGVDSTQVSAWAGHSVAVLHRVYAHVIAGRSGQSRALVESVLGAS